MPKKTSVPARSLRPTILAVDDSKTVRRLAQTALSDFDCEVSEADNGYKAFYAMERALPGQRPGLQIPNADTGMEFLIDRRGAQHPIGPRRCHH